MAEVVLTGIGKVYPDGTRAVGDLSLDIADGEFLVLVGPSGCGKTTALRMVAGLEEISEGTVSVGGRVVNRVPSRDRDVAMVFQSYALYPHLSVRQNIASGSRCARCPRRRSASVSTRRPGRSAWRTTSSGGRATCPAGSVSVSRWAARSSVSRRRSSWTSRCPTSTPSCGCRCAPRSPASSVTWASRRSTSRTTRPRR